MKPFIKPVLVVLATLTLTACGMMNPKSLPYYHAGSPHHEGYDEQGIVESPYYPSNEKQVTQRRMVVYLPRDYYQSTRRYPVIYLLHGARGYETSWIVKGDVLHLYDSLRACGKMEEAIVVMPNMNQYDNDADCDSSRLKNALESLLEINGEVEYHFVKDVVGYVDSHYRTLTDKAHRAIGGLSLGAMQSRFISAQYPDMFDYVGMFSITPMICPASSEHDSLYWHSECKTALQFAQVPKLYLMTVGNADFQYGHVSRLHRSMRRKGYEHTFIVLPGGHDWPVWKESLIYFMEHCFRQ